MSVKFQVYSMPDNVIDNDRHFSYRTCAQIHIEIKIVSAASPRFRPLWIKHALFV